MADDVNVTVAPPAAEVQVVVEPELQVVVEVSDVGLVGPRGQQGIPGPRGQDGDGSQGDLDSHVYSDTPHPAYDDGVSFLLLYQNAKV